MQTPQEPARDLLWKASGLSRDNTESGMGVLRNKTLKPTEAALREGLLSKLEELYGKGGQRCLR